MVDDKAGRADKASVRVYERRLRSKLQGLYAARLDVRAARSYSDDEDMRPGALSAPKVQLRPGQRDDEVRNTFTRLIPAL